LFHLFIFVFLNISFTKHKILRQHVHRQRLSETTLNRQAVICNNVLTKRFNHVLFWYSLAIKIETIDASLIVNPMQITTTFPY